MDVTTAVLQGQKTRFSTLYNFDNVSIYSAALVGQWWHSSVRNGTTRNVGRRGARKAFGSTSYCGLGLSMMIVWRVGEQVRGARRHIRG
jgi:hypothetical protein